MRRHALHICTALLAFTVAFLTADSYENLAYALPLALLVFTPASLIAKLRAPTFDSHMLKVVALSLLLWIPLFALFMQFVPQSGLSDCTFDFAEEDAGAFRAAAKVAQDTAEEESAGNTVAGITAYSCGEADVYPTGLNPVWVGVVDRKAVAKPAPFYPPDAKAAHAEGTVAVSVLIDESGMVVWAQAISGHPLLRQPAMDAACYARFAPTLVVGPPLRASGVLTFDFVLKYPHALPSR